MNEKVEHLRNLRVRLKSGEYDGVDIMAAWIALEEYADLLEQESEIPLNSKVRHYLTHKPGSVVAIDTKYEIQGEDGQHWFAWHRELEPYSGSQEWSVT